MAVTAGAQPRKADQQRALDSLRRELGTIEQQIATGRSSEQDILREMDAHERQVAVLEELVRRQQQQMTALQDSVALLQEELGPREQQLAELAGSLIFLEDDYTRLARSLARAMLAERRLSRWAALEFILGSRTWRELLARRMTIERLQRTQRQGLAALNAAVDTLQAAESEIFDSTRTLRERKLRLEQHQAEAVQMAQALGTDLEVLERQKTALQDRLKQIRGDQKLLAARRRQIEAAQGEIEAMISRIARSEPIAGMPLLNLKGRLPWPCAGRVAQEYGVVRNRELGTQTDNPGLEIATGSAAVVSSVADGRVSQVTRLRGYGNVCIVEHPGAFYTVYAKLGQIVVQPNEELRAGAMIGYAGFDAPADGHRVHFEIWAGKEKKNPREWLAPR